ncbi:MAG: TaqI-like C-terminal specificity domain-containing protein [Polyangiaceae bacterium]
MAARVQAPEALQRLRETHAPFPSDTFRELGFQTTTVVTKNLLLRDLAPRPPFDLPLLEGRDVSEFIVRAPRLFLNADRDLLRRARCKLRSREEYEGVKFVVRQTAKYTIAALHTGHAFRNSLIAGFDCAAFGAQILVGLLNSTLIRAIHLASQRDARQKTFPQVKVAHLRSLPAPPPSSARAAKFAQLVRGFTGTPLDSERRQRLDAFVYDWYGVSAEEAEAVERFFVDRNRGQESQNPPPEVDLD